jgi:hypothetical protein
MREQLFSIPFLLITGRPDAGLKCGRGFEVIKIPITGTALREALGRLIDVDLIEVDSQPDSTVVGRQRRAIKRKRQRKPNVA